MPVIQIPVEGHINLFPDDDCDVDDIACDILTVKAYAKKHKIKIRARQVVVGYFEYHLLPQTLTFADTTAMYEFIDILITPYFNYRLVVVEGEPDSYVMEIG